MEFADIILKGKHIFCGMGNNIDGFVAVKDNRILAVGSSEEMDRYINDETEVIDCGEKTVMPGFHDCHVHVIDGGIFNKGLQLGDSATEEEAAEMVKKYADANPELPWIIGYGWYQIYWESKELPTKASLDALIPDRPVFLQNEDGHGAWVNSKALEVCGIDKNTKDPDFGKIFRDENGDPTGYLDELAMMICAYDAYDLPAEYERGLLWDFMREANRYGITSVNDMRPLFDLDLGNLDNYISLDEEGKQSVRINFSTNLFHPIEDSIALRERFQGGKLHYAGLKEFMDGVAISYTAALKDEYSDRPGWKGDLILDKERLNAAVIKAVEAGLPVHLHATGDDAVKTALDAYEIGMKANGGRKVRHSIEHIDSVDPADIPRFSEMDIVASMQPEHMAPTDRYEDNPYVDRLGEERVKWTWAINSILKAGTHVAFGTDYPVVGMNPMNGIYRAVTRRHEDGLPVEGWNSKERVSIEQAMHNYTYGSAYMVGREDELGTLEAGKLADITVLDRDLLNTEVEEIRDITVSMTISDGRIVYRNI